MAATLQKQKRWRTQLRIWLVGFLLITFVLFLLVGYFLARTVSESYTRSSFDEVSAIASTNLQLRAGNIVSPTNLLSTPKPAKSQAEKEFSGKAYAMVSGFPYYYIEFWSPSGQLIWRDRSQAQIGQMEVGDLVLKQALAGQRGYKLEVLPTPRNDIEGIDALLDIYVPLFPIGGSLNPVGVVAVQQDVSELYNNLQLGQAQLYYVIIFATVALYIVLVLVVIAAADTVRRYQQRAQRRESLLLDLRRQFSPAVADAIIALGDNQTMSKNMTARVEASVLFVDIRNFTNQTASMPPEDVVAMLNAYMDTGTRVIFSYDGVVDKFLGDGILAVFGIPNLQSDHALRACIAALSLRRELADLNAQRTSTGKPPVHVGMGIASGLVVAGNIGSANQLTYTVIGDTVNLASRLVGLAAAEEILLTEATVKLAGSRLNTSGGESVQIRGRDDTVRVYRLLDQPIIPLLASGNGERPHPITLTTRLSEVDSEATLRP